MGIFPYQSPLENSRMNRCIQHYKDFCKLKGYEVLEDHGWGNKCWPGPKPTFPWKGKNGKLYADREEFRKDNEYYPYYIKDGICYGCYEVQYLEKYIDPWDDEVKFLEGRGYTRFFEAFSHDYLENIDLEHKFYEDNGWIPRWEKDDQKYGHEQLLSQLNYKYSGEPDFPFLADGESL